MRGVAWWQLLLLVGHTIGTTSPNKLDVLKTVLVTIQGASITEMATLKASDAIDRTQILGLMNDLRTHSRDLQAREDELRKAMSNLDAAVIPALRVQQTQCARALEALDRQEQLENTTFATAMSASDVRLSAYTEDHAVLNDLAQHTADLVHDQDAVKAAAELHGVVSTRVGYTGTPLSSVCESREEMNGALASLMQHLASAGESEISFRTTLTSRHDATLKLLVAERVARGQTLIAEDERMHAVLAELTALRGAKSTVEEEHSQTRDHMSLFVKTLEDMTHVLVDRVKVLSYMTTRCNEMVGAVSRLETMRAIRALSTT